MMDEYSTIQTDQITEIFKRGMNYAVFRKPDTGAEFAAITLVFVIKELEQDRALWPDVRMIYHYLSKKYHQIPLSGRR